ncbi:MAG: proliferating cell nuclear antigen (pcna) [Candidatus Pacearchaeota archaeon]
MKITLSNPKQFIDTIYAISEIVNEVRIKFEEEGISLIALDPANVAMVIFKMPKESFLSYEVEKETIALNLEDLKKILKRAYSSSSLTFITEDNILKVSLSDKTNRVFTVTLIDLETEERKEPNLEFNCEVDASSEEFSQAIEDCSVVADSCRFVSNGEKFTIEAQGSLSSVKVEFSKDSTTVKGNAKAKYSVDYLMRFIKASKIADKVKIRFSDDYPLKLDFAGEKLGLSFILAQRVDND